MAFIHRAIDVWFSRRKGSIDQGREISDLIAEVKRLGTLANEWEARYWKRADEARAVSQDAEGKIEYCEAVVGGLKSKLADVKAEVRKYHDALHPILKWDYVYDEDGEYEDNEQRQRIHYAEAICPLVRNLRRELDATRRSLGLMTEDRDKEKEMAEIRKTSLEGLIARNREIEAKAKRFKLGYRDAKSNLAMSNAEVARLQALGIKEAEESPIVSMGVVNGGVELSLRPPHWAMRAICDSFGESLDNAKNFAVYQIGPMPITCDHILVTIQRTTGNTPEEKYREAKGLLTEIRDLPESDLSSELYNRILTFLEPKKKD